MARRQRHRRTQGSQLASGGGDGGRAAVAVRGEEGDCSEAGWRSGGDLGSFLRMIPSVSVCPPLTRAGVHGSLSLVAGLLRPWAAACA